MFASNRSVIAKGVKIVGDLSSDGLLKVHGRVEGALQAASVFVSPDAKVLGTIEAEHVVVDGAVEGPVRGKSVLLKSRAHVSGDIQCGSLVVEKGASIEGRLVRGYGADDSQPEREKILHDLAKTNETESELLSQAEDSTRIAELAVEARHSENGRRKAKTSNSGEATDAPAKP